MILMSEYVPEVDADGWPILSIDDTIRLTAGREHLRPGPDR